MIKACRQAGGLSSDLERMGRMRLQCLNAPGRKQYTGKRNMQKMCILAGLVILCCLFSVITDNFLTAKNIMNIALQTSICAIVSIGMTYVIGGGGIDLSVGSVAAFCGMTGALLMKAGFPIWLSVTAAVMIGGLLGILNGFVIAVMGIAPFIATLGMNSVIRGTVYVMTDGVPVTGLPKGFGKIGGGRIGGWLPYAVIIMAVIAVIMAVILKKSHFGRNIFAVGSNEQTAYLSGVKVIHTKIGMYMTCGILSAIAGIILTSRLVTAAPTAGDAYETDAIAATVIGGASLAGGSGSISGTMIGAFIMGVLRNGLNLVGLNYFWQQIAIGFVIIIAVYIDVVRGKMKK